jgi:hypothetical protein
LAIAATDMSVRVALVYAVAADLGWKVRGVPRYREFCGILGLPSRQYPSGLDYSS